jgi:hypothetical protein
MARRVHPDKVSTARLLLVEYYTSGRRRHTFESIAKRAGVSRSTVAILAREIRNGLPTVTDLLRRIEDLERRLTMLETSSGRKVPGRDANERRAA